MFSANTSQVAAGGGAVFVEDIFSTTLYTGTASALTITNGIDLSTKGGLVWGKNRAAANEFNRLSDTVRGGSSLLFSNSTSAAQTQNNISAFNTNGFSLTDDSALNYSANSYVSWTFRKQPKFFDVVAGTGKGTFTHNLGVVPGCVIFKSTTSTGGWSVFHSGLTGGINGGYACLLNTTSAEINVGASLSVTSTTFDTTSYIGVSDSWVAYFYASNAGGFGLTGTDNVISCGSYTGNGSATGPVVTLGYEPQWLMIKRATGTANGNWVMLDVMRGFSTSTDNELYANLSLAEGSGLDLAEPQSTGFQLKSSSSGVNASGSDYIYIAIRRGPMKVPTSGTSVFSTTVQTGVNTSAGQFITTNFPPDFSIEAIADTSSGTKWTIDRLRGNNQFLDTAGTAGESSLSPYGITYTTSNVGVQNLDYGTTATSYVDWLFRRAPSFFDEVCYTENSSGSSQVINHNLGVIPEMIIAKSRSNISSWPVYITSGSQRVRLNSDEAAGSVSLNPTATTFDAVGNPSGYTMVTYLFATCAGVSKVGSYTGNGSTQTINCGFTGGARFVLIKRTDATGDWYVYDTARGMTTLNSPYASLNNAGGSTATLGSVTTVSTGFAVNASILAAINTNAASYIFLAIA